jgi:hypothetical protein
MIMFICVELPRPMSKTILKGLKFKEKKSSLHFNFMHEVTKQLIQNDCVHLCRITETYPVRTKQYLRN